jgi:hypothetical protein
LFDKNSLGDELGIPKKELHVKKKNSQDVTLQLRVVEGWKGQGYLLKRGKPDKERKGRREVREGKDQGGIGGFENRRGNRFF